MSTNIVKFLHPNFKITAPFPVVTHTIFKQLESMKMPDNLD